MFIYWNSTAIIFNCDRIAPSLYESLSLKGWLATVLASQPFLFLKTLIIFLSPPASFDAYPAPLAMRDWQDCPQRHGRMIFELPVSKFFIPILKGFDLHSSQLIINITGCLAIPIEFSSGIIFQVIGENLFNAQGISNFL